MKKQLALALLAVFVLPASLSATDAKDAKTAETKPAEAPKADAPKTDAPAADAKCDSCGFCGKTKNFLFGTKTRTGLTAAALVLAVGGTVYGFRNQLGLVSDEEAAS